jgi:hypothetical protein
MGFIIQNFDLILTGVTSAVTLASVIVKFTPNETDNKIVEGVLNFLNIVAINNRKRGE